MYLFVYGSLKKDFKFHFLLEKNPNVSFINKAKTLNHYTMYKYLNMDFPYITKEENYSIPGELYEINKSALKDIDHLEAYPSLYDRELTMVETEDKKRFEAIIYFIKEKPLESSEKLKEWTLDLEQNSQ